jgi:hypothetical protein
MSSDPAQPSVAVAESPPLAESLICPACGYDLRGIASERCPECGAAVDRTSLGVSRIPWIHREKIGRVRAYLTTMRLAMFRPRALAEGINRPVPYADSQRFRAVTIILAAAGPVAFCIVAMLRGDWLRSKDAANTLLGPDSLRVGEWLAPWMEGAALYPVIPIAIVLTLVFLTGAGSYFFAPKSLDVTRQNRAIALSYYASAPLALLPVISICLGIDLWGQAQFRYNHWLWAKISTALTLVEGVLGVFVFLAMGNTTRRLLSVVTPGRGMRVHFAEFAIMVFGVLTAALALVVFPWCVGFIAVVAESLS